MSQLDFMLKHSVLARLDATIEQFDDVFGQIDSKDNKADSQMRRNQFMLMQTRREILNVREAAVATLTRLNTFGATLEIMAQPEVGVDQVVEDIMKWFILLTECDRAFMSLHDEKHDGTCRSVFINGWKPIYALKNVPLAKRLSIKCGRPEIFFRAVIWTWLRHNIKKVVAGGFHCGWCLGFR